jgi:predicted ferric reductase
LLVGSFCHVTQRCSWLKYRITDREYFICGPDVMMDAIEKALGQLNVPLSKYHSERYSFV